MKRAIVNLKTIYEYEPKLFEFLKLPKSINASTLINNLMFEFGDRHLITYNPLILQSMIGEWSAMELDNWERMELALESSYNPIENYDRHEEWTDTGNGENTARTAGYNTNEFTPLSNSDSSSTGNHSGRIHGNIGVTTNQQMIEAEISLRKNNSLYNIISNSFANKFLTGVYF